MIKLLLPRLDTIFHIIISFHTSHVSIGEYWWWWWLVDFSNWRHENISHHPGYRVLTPSMFLVIHSIASTYWRNMSWFPFKNDWELIVQRRRQRISRASDFRAKKIVCAVHGDRLLLLQSADWRLGHYTNFPDEHTEHLFIPKTWSQLPLQWGL